MSELLKTRRGILVFAMFCCSLAAIALLDERSFRVEYFQPDGEVLKQPYELEVCFSRPVVSDRDFEQGVAVPPAATFSVAPALAGEWRWKSPRSAVFRPAPGALVPNTRYTLRVKAGIRSVDGAALALPAEGTFVYDRFTAVGCVFPGSDKRMELKPDLVVLFTQPVDLASARRHVSLVAGNGTRLAVQLVELTNRPGGWGYYSKQFVEWEFLSQRVHQAGAPPLYAYRVRTPELARDTGYTLTFGDGLRSRTGDRTLAKDAVVDFATYGPLFVAEPDKDLEQRPDTWVTLRFSNPLKVSPDAVSNLLEAREAGGRPARVRYVTTYDGSDSVSVAFDFEARSRYRITVKPGAVDCFGQRMTEAKSFYVTTGDFQPSFEVPYPDSSLVESDGRIHDLPMSFVNLLGLKVDVDVYHDPEAYLADKSTKDQRITLLTEIAKRNTRYLQRVDFRPLLRDGRYGYAKVRVSGKFDTDERYNRSFEREYTLQFTALSLTAKIGPGGMFLHVTGLSSARPADGVEVKVADGKTGEVLWSGWTDPHGNARVPASHPAFGRMVTRGYDQPALKIIARREGDFCVLTRTYENMVYLYNSEIGYPSTRVRDWHAHVFTPKGLYKKDETVQIKGYVRSVETAGLRVPAGRAWRLTCTSPDGKEALSKTVTLSRFGSFSAELPLSADPPLGRWQLRLAEAGGGDEYGAAEGSFMVEAYRERDFEVQAAIGKSGAVHVDGDKLPLEVKGNYLYGGRMREGKLKVRVEAYPHQFTATSGLLAPYTFSSAVWFDPADGKGPVEKSGQSVALSRLDLALDKQGEFRDALPARVPFPCAARFVLSAEVEDAKRQSIVATAGAVVHKGDFLLGFRFQSYFVSTAEPVVADIVAATPDERSAGARAVEVRVYREEWNNVRKLSADGYYRWHYERKYVAVRTEKTATAADLAHPRRLALRVSEPGAYVVTFRARDGAGREITNLGYFYAWGGGSVPWRMSDDQTIGLVRDKDVYKPGETARIMVKSPYREVDALVTVEREGVLDSFRVRLKGGADTVSVPIRLGWEPNVFVSVFLLQGRLDHKYPEDKLKDIYKPTVKVGYTVLNIDRDHKRLRVAAWPNKAVYEPGERVTLGLVAADKNKNGVSCELSVYVVDEGVLQIIGYRTPDPWTYFFDMRRQLQVFSYDTRLRVLGQHGYSAKGENPGGDKGGDENRRSSLGMSNLKLRQLFKAVAYAKHDIVTDDYGNATVSFVLPDNLTKYRVMVVAADGVDRFGSAEKQITVTRGLVIRPALPRFLAVGDKASAGFVVDNNTGQPGLVNVAATARGAATLGAAPSGAPAAFRLEPGASREVRFAVAAAAPGEAVFDFSATMAAGGTTLGDRVQWKIPVTGGPMKRALVKSDELEGTATNLRYALPLAAVPGTARWQVFASSTALARLAGAFDYLFGYPYGCLEQKLSRVLPMLLAGEMVKSFGGAPGVDHRKLVQTYLDELESYRDKNGGGFYMWPEREYQYLASPTLSVTLLYALHVARGKGYRVDGDVFKQALGWTRKYLARSGFSTARYPYDERYWIGADALALHVLAEIGEADDSYVDAIYAKMGGQPLYVKITLAQALHKLGRDKHRERLAALLSEIGGAVRYEGDFAYFKEEFSRWDWSRNLYLSDVKTMGAALNLLLAAEPAHRLVPMLTRGLVRAQRGGAWRTTQENMYACWAFANYFETREREVPAFNFSIAAAGRTLLSGAFFGRSMTVREATAPMGAGSADGTHELAIGKQGRGRLYYTTRLAYVSRETPKRENAGFEVERTYHDSRGKLVKNGRFKAGESYKVTLRVTSERPRYDVVVDSPLPAGLEALNPRLERTSLDVDAARDSGQSAWWWYGFNRVMMKDDRVCLFADTLRADTHEYTFFVKAITAGEFVSWPARAEEMYNPDICGQTDGGRVVVE